jgi:putative ABC transport system substrate-binding protein
MDRRAFLGVIAGGLLAAPLAAEAQQAAKVPLIGTLDYGAPDAARLEWWTAFRETLRQMGYEEGRSIAFEARWAEGRVDRLPALAAELVRLQVNVIVTGGGETARAAKQATATIPIVMATGSDPVRLGVVSSLAQPGGNVTGVTSLSSELIAKRLQLLRELLPKVSRVAILSDETLNSRTSVRDTEVGARTLHIEIRPVGVRDPKQLEQAIAGAHRERAAALIVIASPSLFIARGHIADLALKHRLPTVLGGREYAEAGGLLSYAVSYPGLFRRAALYVDKILKGAKPADLPIEQPTKFELVINLKTAKALGLTIPPSLLQRADQVIE